VIIKNLKNNDSKQENSKHKCSLAYGVNQFKSSIAIRIYLVKAIKRNKTNTMRKIDVRYLCMIVDDF